MNYRVMVTGGRDWTDAALIHSDLREVDAVHRAQRITLVVGDCPTGADLIACVFACDVLGWELEEHRAAWDQHGKAAGPIRNQEMVDSKPHVCYAYPTPRSHGTWDAVRRAQRANVPTHVRTEAVP